MPGSSRLSRAQLDEFARTHPECQTLPLAPGWQRKEPWTAVLVGPDTLTPVDEQARPAAPIAFDEIEQARVTEDAGNRYRVELSLAREGDDVALHFDSRVLFLVLFSALRAREVACRFDFTARRQRGGGTTDLVRVLRVVVALGASALYLAFLWANLPSDEIQKSGIQVLIGSGVGAVLICALLLFLFHRLYEIKSTATPVPLMDPPGRPEADLELDDRPLGAALIAGETYTGVGSRPGEAAAGPEAGTDARQISEIERLLE